MDTKTLHVCALIGASPKVVYHALTDPETHSAFTAQRSELKPEPGGSFSYFDGLITGEYVDLRPPQRITQKLRASAWPEGLHATVRTDLEEVGGGASTVVSVVEEGVPSGHLDEVTKGWGSYWLSLSEYLRRSKKDVVGRFVEEFKNRHNPDIVDDLVSEDCGVHIPLPGLPPGREGLRLNGQMVNSAFPDVVVEREFFVAEGDIVVERAIANATHKGELIGISPTGNPVTWTELHAYRVQDGLITEVWSEADFMGIMEQIGAFEAPSQ